MYYNPRIKEIDNRLVSIQEEINYGESLRKSYENQPHISTHLEELKNEKQKLEREKLELLREKS